MRASGRACLTLIFCGTVLMGCNMGSGGSGSSVTTLSLETKPSSVPGGTTFTFQGIIIHNHQKFLGATWTLSSNGAACQPACGQLGTPTSNGSPGNGDTVRVPYMAPTSYANPVTITAASVENPSSTDSDTFTVTGPPLSIQTSSLPSGTINVAYQSTTLQAAGGVSPYTWSVISGSLPTGLQVNPSSGTVSGTPTATGTFSFTIQVNDSSGGSATATLSITVNTAQVS